MATHVEMEIKSCLTEMEQLQAKIRELQDTKIKLEIEKEEKTTKIEPNMAIMEKWFESVIGERENAKKAKKLYESLTGDTSLEKRQHIFNLRRVYYNNRLEKWMHPDPEPLFHIQKHKAPDTPSQFMIDFIEATYNLFQIQQKRIDELETVVAELSAKIQ